MRRSWIIAMGLSTGLLAGCGEAWINNTAPLEGALTIVFVNNTGDDAVFSMGVWNDLDRQRPRQVNLVQPRISALTTSETLTLPCGRNLAIGTQALVDWTLLSNAVQEETFEPALLNTTVFFNNEPSDSPAFNAPVGGKAEGVELLVGVDYSCDDQIIFTFEEDPDAPGGYRIDYAVIRDVNRDL